jgi:protein-tyrosine phosphatase
MIDLHNHILPRIDDGARNIDEALTMAGQAVDQGTTIMAATPHRFHGGHEYAALFIEEAVGTLQRHIDKSGIALKIIPGIELPMRPDTADMLQSGGVIPIGGPSGKFVLIEPPFDRVPSSALHILESIIGLGLTPVLAHPERNAEIQKSLAFVETCASRGIPMQLTAGAITGKFGASPMRCAKEIAERRDWTIIISSDAHDTAERNPSDMREAVETVAGWISDEAAAWRMVEDTPRGMLPI